MRKVILALVSLLLFAVIIYATFNKSKFLGALGEEKKSSSQPSQQVCTDIKKLNLKIKIMIHRGDRYGLYPLINDPCMPFELVELIKNNQPYIECVKSIDQKVYEYGLEFKKQHPEKDSVGEPPEAFLKTLPKCPQDNQNLQSQLEMKFLGSEL